jgi:hypothetical protein
MSYVQIESLVKAFGETEIIHGIGLEIENRNLLYSSDLLVAARPPSCA